MNTLTLTVIDPIAKLLGTWSSNLTVGSVLFRIALSVVLSAVIGCERSSKRHAAGLRRGQRNAAGGRTAVWL